MNADGADDDVTTSDTAALAASAAAPGTPSMQQRQAARRTTLLLYASIAAGGVLGSLLRWLVGLGFQQMFGAAFPWGTLFINVTGSFFIGFYAELTGPTGRLLVSPRMRQGVMTGICGGYTTFSSFSLETFRFLHAGDSASAATYVGISIITWLAAVWAGEALAERFNRLKGA